MPRGLIAGAVRDAVYEVNLLALEPGDLLVMYTDGVTEARNEAKEFFGIERLKDCLSALEINSASDLVNAVRTKVNEFTGAADQADDMTIMALRFCGSN